MKKIFTLLVVFLAFAANSNAQSQDRSSTNDIKAKQDYEALAKVVTISPEAQEPLIRVLIKKYDAAAQPNLSAESKQNISKNIEGKIQQILGPKTIKELEKHKDVYTQLISVDAPASEKK